nr:MAG: hypothetical protein DIU78_13860 [Pseudomonadota bacterium]
MRELNLGRFAGVCSAAPWAVLGAKGPGVSQRDGALLRCARRTQSGPMPEANAPCGQPLTQPSAPASEREPATSAASRVGELEGR